MQQAGQSLGPAKQRMAGRRLPSHALDCGTLGLRDAIDDVEEGGDMRGPCRWPPMLQASHLFGASSRAVARVIEYGIDPVSAFQRVEIFGHVATGFTQSGEVAAQNGHARRQRLRNGHAEAFGKARQQQGARMSKQRS